MNTITYPQIKQIFKLLPKKAATDKEIRADFVASFTDGRTDSVKELTRDEADLMICTLSGSYSHFAAFDKNNKQHMAVLNLCYELGWTSFNKRLNRHTADLGKLGAFISSKKSPVRKPLMEMTKQEVSKLIYALENILKYNYSKV